MKILLLWSFFIFGQAAYATDYYISSSSGNDSNNGISESSPWRTLDKINAASLSLLKGGDRVLLKKGDIFYGKIVVNKGGNSPGTPIVYSAYGSGSKPVISGFTNITNWTNLGDNIWESTNQVSNLINCNMVVKKDMNIPMGRYPNTGWLTYQSFVGQTSITSSSLTGTPNWTGAEAVIRKEHWVVDRDKIIAQSGNTLTYSTTSSYKGKPNYGFFIQNDAKTLDAQDEWYYSPSTKKIKIYSIGSPGTFQISTIDTLFTIRNKNYITIDGIEITGSNMIAVAILSSANIIIKNCDINFSGFDAISGNRNGGTPSANLVCQNNNISNTNNNAIYIQSEFTNALISGNIIKNTGMILGVGGSGSNGAQGVAIQTVAENAIIEYNEIDSVGYNGIAFYKNNTIVRNNFVANFCMVKDDGAGIYTWVGTGSTPFTGQKVLDNIVMNGIGNNGGTSDEGKPAVAHGIYMDDVTANVEISGNTAVNCAHSGLYIHNARNLNIHDNTFFNNEINQALFASFDASNPIRNVTMLGNIFFSKTSAQKAGSFQTRIDDISSFGVFNDNYWARPIDDIFTFENIINNYTSFSNRSLEQWKSYSGLDGNSSKSPKAITTLNDLRFEYNSGSSNKTITLDGKYIDVKNQIFEGAIVLAPYKSLVLIRIGLSTPNTPPTANAGTSKSITLPTNTTSLNGSGADADGTI
ncbi:MAG TPA: right-handed parallel beta-helix repeat-containing protein, partial [Pedobacter sp.]|nr:right-handed parallel beta-helix repeat-containing protein [Pedobacter sp.]